MYPASYDGFLSFYFSYGYILIIIFFLMGEKESVRQGDHPMPKALPPHYIRS